MNAIRTNSFVGRGNAREEVLALQSYLPGEARMECFASATSVVIICKSWQSGPGTVEGQ